jgi:hypothetical protein
MKLYPSLSVETAYQNCGSWWLVILEGPENEIELTFNGLYNFGATNVSDALEYTDHTRTKAIFWSTPEYMFKFFYESHLLACQQQSCAKHAKVVANLRMEEFRKCSVPFFDFNRTHFCDAFTIGTKSAERPDDNYREQATLHSHKKASERTIDKE